MTVQTYLEGNRLELVATFVNAAGTPTDPTAVVYTILPPSGPSVAYNWPGGPITHPSAGVFALQYDVDAPGVVKVNVTGTGTIHASMETMVVVEESHVL